MIGLVRLGLLLPPTSLPPGSEVLLGVCQLAFQVLASGAEYFELLQDSVVLPSRLLG